MSHKITLEIGDVVFDLLRTLTLPKGGPATVESAILQLIDHAQQGIYRPGSWERAWIAQVFTEDFAQFLEAGDPYERPVEERSQIAYAVFRRPAAREGFLP